MSEWAVKRFWTNVEVEARDAGYTILLDGRSVKTPAKSALIVPTDRLARALAAEWRAQEGHIDPRTMPMTQSANAAIDKVQTQFGEVVEHVAGYGSTDLLCYRADTPQELAARQASGWDPLLRWAQVELGIALDVVTGVMYQPQSDQSVAAMRSLVQGMSPFQLTAAHDLVSLSGSLILGAAVWTGHMAPGAAWDVSRLDETWQQEHWGVDEEAAAEASHKRAAFLHAAQFFGLSSPQ